MKVVNNLGLAAYKVYFYEPDNTYKCTSTNVLACSKKHAFELVKAEMLQMKNALVLEWCNIIWIGIDG